MLSGKRSRDGSHRIGLDIGSCTVKGVEVIENGAELVIRSAGISTILNAPLSEQPADDSATIQAIKALWREARFETDVVALSMPPKATHMKWLNLEPGSEEELDSIARTAAARGAPFSAADAVLDYRVVSTTPAGSHNAYFTMCVAASSSDVDRMLDLAQRAGLSPIAVDLGVSAAVRSFAARDEHSDPLWQRQPKAHCMIGARTTSIAVVRDGKLEFSRTVPVGGYDFTQCIAESLGVDPETAERIKTGPEVHLTDDGTMIAFHGGREASIRCENVVNRLARETIRSLRFFSSQFAEGSYLGMIGTVTLSGGGALLRGMDSCLRREGVEVSAVINPFGGYAVDSGGGGIEQVGATAAAFTTAVGLAITDYADQSSRLTATAA